MKVLIDTSVWSLALRRKEEQLNRQELAYLNELKELLNEGRPVMIGPVRQEILSGISDSVQFNLLKEKLANFNDVIIKTEDYELAAELYNKCRVKGIQGAHIDFLICAVTINNKYSILTTDNDFMQYKRHCDIILHNPR